MAIGHKILVTVYHILSTNREYRDLGDLVNPMAWTAAGPLEILSIDWNAWATRFALSNRWPDSAFMAAAVSSQARSSWSCRAPRVRRASVSLRALGGDGSPAHDEKRGTGRHLRDGFQRPGTDRAHLSHLVATPSERPSLGLGLRRPGRVDSRAVAPHRIQDARQPPRQRDHRNPVAAPVGQLRHPRMERPPPACCARPPTRLDQSGAGRRGPAFVMRPLRCRSPELSSCGTKPKNALARPASSKRVDASTVARYVNAMIGPTPGAVINRATIGSAAACARAAWSARASAARMLEEREQRRSASSSAAGTATRGTARPRPPRCPTAGGSLPGAVGRAGD